ncbi:hypothetical protein GRI39_01905 [Altererythrobacter indicus]|uniref:Uncharacterized protein n=1 Tax=Altericroceibacterium indicum TaxID=374177 RepID=A0A845A3P3_9SPHN|nr:hypothetical protein [Altericroceibacterium indicum]MXP24800.1 hypothetical protein [Altericroceibacterium indicum]
MKGFNFDRLRARAVAGGGVFLLSQEILLMIFFKPDLAESDLFKTISQAIVVQGLIGLAMAFYFTAKERDHHRNDEEE